MERRRNFDKMPTFAQMKAREESYKDDVFAGINQFEYQDEDGYSCKWPIFYRKQRGMLGVFPARYRTLKALLPDDPEIRPVQILPGVSLLYITAIESADTDIEPYNSILIVVPMRAPDFIGLLSPLKIIPGYELFRQIALRKLQDWFIWRIPDDSYISYKVGYEAFGMPKFASDLTWEEEDGRIIYSASDAGEEILTFEAHKIKTYDLKKGFTLNAHACFYRDRLLMVEYGRVLFKQVGLSLGGSKLKLKLGENHPLADELRQVLLSQSPLLWLYFPEDYMIIYEPGRWALDVLDLFHKRMDAGPKQSGDHS